MRDTFGQLFVWADNKFAENQLASAYLASDCRLWGKVARWNLENLPSRVLGAIATLIQLDPADFPRNALHVAGDQHVPFWVEVSFHTLPEFNLALCHGSHHSDRPTFRQQGQPPEYERVRALPSTYAPWRSHEQHLDRSR